jgi:hypothetical protein
MRYFNLVIYVLYYYLPFSFFLNVVLVLSFFTFVVIFLLFNFDLGSFVFAILKHVT